jgi:hypothetical protein
MPYKGTERRVEGGIPFNGFRLFDDHKGTTRGQPFLRILPMNNLDWAYETLSVL